MNQLNFSWIIDVKLAGHQAPSSEQDLIWLKDQGVLALGRIAETHKAKLPTPYPRSRTLSLSPISKSVKVRLLRISEAIRNVRIWRKFPKNRLYPF